MSDNSVMNKAPKSEQFIAEASAYHSHGNMKAQARAGLADVATDNTESIRGHGKVLTFGADAQVGPRYTGLGVEATYVEAGADFGDIGGVKVGLSADTAVGAGTEGLCAKALGTGVKMDKTGTEVTVLGTGLKLGSWSNPYGWFK